MSEPIKIGTTVHPVGRVWAIDSRNPEYVVDCVENYVVACAAFWGNEQTCQIAAHIAEVHNQHDSLVTQRDALLEACEMALDDANSGEKADGRTIDRLAAAIAIAKAARGQ